MITDIELLKSNNVCVCTLRTRGPDRTAIIMWVAIMFSDYSIA